MPNKCDCNKVEGLSNKVIDILLCSFVCKLLSQILKPAILDDSNSSI